MTNTETTLVDWQLDWERPSDGDRAELLKDVPLFSGIGRRHRRELVRRSQVAEYVKGDVVLVSGERADYLYVIISGRAKVYGKSGTQHIVTGDYFGELALIDGEPRSAAVVADGDLHVLKVPGSAFREAVERDSELALAVMRELVARIRRAERSQSD